MSMFNDISCDGKGNKDECLANAGVEHSPLTGYGANTCIDASSEHTPVNYSSRRNSFNADYNDLTTTVAASETPDMKEVGRSTSPLFSQEREVSSSVSLVFNSKR